MTPLFIAGFKWIIGPVGRWVATALAVGFVIWWSASMLIDAGKMAERRRALQQAERARDKADEAERRVLDCPAGKWNKDSRTCEK